MAQGFDFRWGVPLLDNQPGYAKVYEFMLDHYATVITRDEFLCIIHLARYHYNSIKGESRPSLETIAGQMGYSHKNSVWLLVQSLRDKGMLTVTRRPGLTSIYNAAPFTGRMLALAGITSEGITTHCDGGITTHCDGGITTHCDGVSQPIVTEEEKDKEIKEEKKEEKNFLSQTKKSHRERIRDVLSDALDTPVPASPLMVKKWDAGLDSIVADCRAVVGKKRLDAELASQIIAAIRLGVETDEWALLKADYPNASVIGCIPRLLRDCQDKATARATARSEWGEYAERRDQALAERQRLREAEEKPDPFWQKVLGELRLQMPSPAFDTWLKPTKLLAQEEDVIVVGVKTHYAKDWIENRLLNMIERALAEHGVQTVTFEVIALGEEEGGNGHIA